MSKYRVYEIAKDYNTTSKVIIDILARNGIAAKNHMTSIDDESKAVIERTFARKTGSSETSEEKPLKQTPSHQLPAQVRPAQSQTEQSVRPAHQPPGITPSGKPQQQHMRVTAPAIQQQPQQEQKPAQQQPFNDRRPGGQQQSFNDRRPGGQQQSFNDRRPGGQQQSFNDRRPGGQQQPFNDRRPGGQQQPFNDRRPGGQQQSFNDRRPGGQQQSFNDRRPGGQQQPFKDRRPGGQHQPPNDRNPGGQQQQSRPFSPSGSRPGDQNFNRPQNLQGQRPGDRPQQRPLPQQGNRVDAGRPSPATTQQQQANQRPDQPRRGKPETGGQNLKDRQQHQREQIFSKKHEQRRGPAKHGRQHAPVAAKQEPVRPKSIKLGETITVKDLAAKLGRQVSDVIKKLMMLGIMATINQEVDFDTASLIANEFGAAVEQLPPEESATEIADIADDPESLVPRPPVITIMGHVDHGKTSLLDAIRQTHVTAQEAGGITQHIGAYQVNYQGKRIVFLDTPGHEAFTAMRARGAQVTDVAILVVAADDGVMPQTIEAINHAKSAKVPIIVAVNKMDKPDANPDRVKQQLSEHGLIPEDWGGDTIFVPVSAYKKTGIPDLLEMILLVAEMQDLKANPNRDAVGTIIEAQLDKGRGPVATVLVQKGTLHVGDTIIAGTAFGKVRAMINDRGDKVKKAEPSTPVEVLGLSDVPQAGDVLIVADEKVVRDVAEKRAAKRTEEMQKTSKVSLDDLFKQIQEGNIKDLNIVVKADVQGSIEALRQALQNLKNKEVRVNIIHSGVGAINESDVMFASASNALIIGFNVRPDANARKASENEKIDIRTYRVIYDAINDVEAALSGMLAPEFKEVLQGRAEVRQLISVPKTVVAGSYVLEGKITSNSQIRLIRNGIVIYEGKIEALRRFKDDVKEVATGYECGISLEKFRDIKEGDIIEAFTMEIAK